MLLAKGEELGLKFYIGNMNFCLSSCEYKQMLIFLLWSELIQEWDMEPQLFFLSGFGQSTRTRWDFGRLADETIWTSTAGIITSKQKLHRNSDQIQNGPLTFSSKELALFEIFF